MIRLPTSIFLLTLAAACSPAEPTLSPSIAGGDALRIRQVPERFEEFRRTDVHRFPQAELGVAYRYSDGSPLRLDLYIYPLPAGAEGAVASGLAARQEGGQLPVALRVQQARGRIRSFELLADSAVQITLPDSVLNGSHVSLRIDPGGRMLESHQHVFVLGDRYVKTRSSFPPGALLLADLERIITALLTSMTTAGEPAAAPR